MCYFKYLKHYNNSNLQYFTTLLVIASSLLSSNLSANTTLPIIPSQISTNKAKTTQQGITQKDALFQAMLAEFDVENGNSQSAIEQYIPLALYSPSINAKRRTLDISLENNDLDASFAVTNAWVEQEPQDIPALLYLAHTSLRTHRYNKFVSVVERILQIDKDAQIDQIVKGIVPEDANDRQILLDSLYTIKNKNNPSLLILIATLQTQNDQLELALENINKALKQRPSTTSFLLFKANLLIAMDRQDEALKWLKTSARKYKHNTDVQLAEIQLLFKDKQEDLAIKRLEYSLKHNPNAEDVLFLAGLTYIDQKQYDKTEQYLQKLQSSQRYQNDALYYLGINAERRQHFDAALTYFNQVDGTLYILSRQAIIQIYEQLEQPNEALQFLTQERVNYPDYASFLYKMQAELLQKLGQKKQALALLKEASKDLPDDADLLYAQITLLDPHQHRNELDKLLNKLIQLEPNNPHYLNAYAYTLALQNRELSKARQFAERALQNMPNQATYLDTLGYIAFLQNDFKTATKALEQAYEENDDLLTAIKLAKALYMNGDLPKFNQLVKKLRIAYPDNNEITQLEMLLFSENLAHNLQQDNTTHINYSRF